MIDNGQARRNVVGSKEGKRTFSSDKARATPKIMLTNACALFGGLAVLSRLRLRQFKNVDIRSVQNALDTFKHGESSYRTLSSEIESGS